MTYWLRRKQRQIKKLIRYIPVIWKSFDFDYGYAIDLFKMQLEDIAKHLESNKAVTSSSKSKAREVRKAICLLERVYDEKYITEEMTKLDKFYGKMEFKFVIVEGYPEMFSLEKEYPEDWDKAQIAIYKKDHKESLLRGIAQQRKAHRILWMYIEHKIEGWWD